jgi:hypothetical protein
MPQVGKVFVSHASADKPFVDRLVADLAARSVPVWYDKLDLRIGESVPGAINAGLSDSKYFAIVLSKASVASAWVREELNAALMAQVAKGGTFILPLLLEDCAIPPLLAHRKYADFRIDYSKALTELLSLWGKDADACAATSKAAVHPWPDIEMSDEEFIYLHSTRFDKFFRMSCSLDWTATRTVDYLTETLALPWNIEVSSVGMKWSFSYGLRLDGKGISLDTKLRDAGIAVGSVVQIGISGVYEDLYEKELKEAFSRDKVYLETIDRMQREQWLRQQVAARRLLTNSKLKEIADSCFSHV